MRDTRDSPPHTHTHGQSKSGLGLWVELVHSATDHTWQPAKYSPPWNLEAAARTNGLRKADAGGGGARFSAPMCEWPGEAEAAYGLQDGGRMRRTEKTAAKRGSCEGDRGKALAIS